MGHSNNIFISMRKVIPKQIRYFFRVLMHSVSEMGSYDTSQFFQVTDIRKCRSWQYFLYKTDCLSHFCGAGAEKPRTSGKEQMVYPLYEI